MNKKKIIFMYKRGNNSNEDRKMRWVIAALSFGMGLKLFIGNEKGRFQHYIRILSAHFIFISFKI